MANTRELRRRIKSIKNTSQITKAMQMVAATKMRKAQVQALEGRPYSEILNISLSKMVSGKNIESHPLLLENDSKEVGFLVLSTDKSLCGSLNTNLFRALSLYHSGTPRFFTIGSKGRSFVVKTGQNLQADFENPEIVAYSQAKIAAKAIIASFLAGEIKEAFLAYPHFVSTLRQEPRIVKILPISADIADLKSNSFLFEPGPDELLNFVLYHHIEVQIYQSLLETKASEHSARMIAMQNATDNTLELVDDLNLTYNQTRQGAITAELLEITTAAAAME